MRTPKLCRHKGTAQAYVTLDGREHYLGPWPAGQRKAPPAARAAYDELVARWLTNGRRLPDDPAEPVSVNEVILSFVQYADTHYHRSDSGSCEADGIRDAVRVVKELYGRAPAAQFGPRALKAVRARMVELGWGRTYVNKQVNRVKRMFRWAAAEELIPPAVAHGLASVPAIRRGVPGVRETEPVRPVSVAHVEAALPFMSPQVRAMVELQLLTGMRPGEVVVMRGCDLDTSGRVWVYRPAHHKTVHRGQTREVFLGPRAQAVVKPWLRTELAAYLFSPGEADADRRRRQRELRVSKVQPSQRDRRKKDPTRKPGARYTSDSYAGAIEYACRKADRLAREEAVKASREANSNAAVDEIEASVYVPAWGPNRLRHNAATELRKEFGIELARIVLGHSTAFTTEIYAEADRVQAMDAVLRVG